MSFYSLDDGSDDSVDSLQGGRGAEGPDELDGLAGGQQLDGDDPLHVLHHGQRLPGREPSHRDVVLGAGTGGQGVHGRRVAQHLVFGHCFLREKRRLLWVIE